MKRFKDTYRIETTRLPGYDYASPGWYCVTICTKDRVCFFGDVRGGIVGLSAVGCMAHQCWAAIPDHADHTRLDAFVVMPNHVHGIVGLSSRPNDDRGRDARSRVSTKTANAFGPLKPGALQTVVHAYKGAVTRWARRNGHPDFAWQSRFWDRVIRNDRELQATRRYIHENILKWHLDRNHPDNR